MKLGSSKFWFRLYFLQYHPVGYSIGFPLIHALLIIVSPCTWCLVFIILPPLLFFHPYITACIYSCSFFLLQFLLLVYRNEVFEDFPKSLTSSFTPFTPSATFYPFMTYFFCSLELSLLASLLSFAERTHLYISSFIHSFPFFTPTKSLDCASKSRSTSGVVVSLDRSTTVTQDQVHVSTALSRQWC